MSEVQSKAISKINTLWKRLSNKDYRDAFMSAKIDADLAGQIYALREQQSLTQEELGHRALMAQSRIAKLEGSCEGVSVATLKRLAAAFDVGLQIKFVPFSDIITSSVRDNLDRPVPSYTNDRTPADGFQIKMSASSGHSDFVPNLRASGGREMYREGRIYSSAKVLRKTVNA